MPIFILLALICMTAAAGLSLLLVALVSLATAALVAAGVVSSSVLVGLKRRSTLAAVRTAI